jgi:hypothetical protein
MYSNSRVLRTAYILQIHKNPDQVNKFINQIISIEKADVYVHIDKKNYDQLYGKILKSPNVVILKESFDVIWGDITQVDATILLLREVIASGKSYDFVCFRSGQDLLVKNGFKEYLINNKNKIFMNVSYVENNDPHASFINVRWPKKARRLYINPFHPYRLFRRAVALIYGLGINLLPNEKSLPEKFSIYEGSNWFCIPFHSCQYIIEFLDTNQWYYEVFKNSLVPDQFFFQTIIMNSKYKSDVVNNNLMYIKFGDSLKGRNNPITLRMEHIDVIKNSNEFFARKFDEDVDKHVIEHYANNINM